jgi:hypothetical protein
MNRSTSIYYNRGHFRMKVGDRVGGLADLQKAADLSLTQGRTVLYEKVIKIINESR